MKALYDPQAPDKIIRLSVNSDLLNRAHELNINFSSLLEAALKTTLAEQQAKQWKTENHIAVKAYNDFVEENGCFSDDYRIF